MILNRVHKTKRIIGSADFLFLILLISRIFHLSLSLWLPEKLPINAYPLVRKIPQPPKLRGWNWISRIKLQETQQHREIFLLSVNESSETICQNCIRWFQIKLRISPKKVWEIEQPMPIALICIFDLSSFQFDLQNRTGYHLTLFHKQMSIKTLLGDANTGLKGTQYH